MVEDRNELKIMQNLFVSFHFSDDFDSPDRLLVDRVEGLLKSHGLAVTNGAILGGDPLTDRIRVLIEKSDALIAIMTRKVKKNNGNYYVYGYEIFWNANDRCYSS